MELSYDCQKNFEKVKFLLVDSDVQPRLVNYSDDASNYDVGAVISHIMLNRLEKPNASYIIIK